MSLVKKATASVSVAMLSLGSFAPSAKAEQKSYRIDSPSGAIGTLAVSCRYTVFLGTIGTVTLLPYRGGTVSVTNIAIAFDGGPRPTTGPNRINSAYSPRANTSDPFGVLGRAADVQVTGYYQGTTSTGRPVIYYLPGNSTRCN